METAFTPWQSLGGGALIGVASVLLMASLGRIMGATGILAGLLYPANWSDWSWRAAILAGMVSGPLAVSLLTGQMPAVQVPISTTMMIIGGFLVGVGVTYGGGCTSGHGVCGVGRLSKRSIVATSVFVGAGALSVWAFRAVVA